MSITQCPECQREVSDRAHACPQCGFPVKKEAHKLRRQQMQWGGIERIKTYAFVAIPLFILGGGWLFIIVRFFPEVTLRNMALTLPTILAGVMFIIGALGLVAIVVSLSEVAVLGIWNKIFR